MRLLPVLPLLLLALAGCGDDASPEAAPAPTVTVTVTETVTPTPTAVATEGQTPLPTPSDGPTALPQLELEVFHDGCGVIRSEEPPGAAYHNLTWVFRDQDGFQVLGRNAEGETRYRHFGGGTYDVVLEAWGGEGYVPVSNEVTVRC